ncbi:MAG: hypothetical protein PWP04_1414 [Candidatus Atribacteria bacterium]|nr:hypothetical protein [Candidatus Atribacteria bacterium]
MNGKKLGLSFLVVVLLVGLVSGVALAQVGGVFMRFSLPQSVYNSIPRSSQIELSVDRGEGATYYVGDTITVRYRPRRAGFVNLVNYLPGGQVQILLRDQPVKEGVTETYRGVVSGPPGTERLVILFTPTPVSDSDLRSVVREPHQVSRILSRSEMNRTYFNVMERVSEVLLEIQPASFTVEPGASFIISAVLEDTSGRPLVARRINWNVSAGSLSSYSTLTNNSGVSKVTFYAPDNPMTVTIRAEFSGEGGLSSAQARATASVESQMRSTTLTISPSSFSAEAGERVRLEAYLEDQNGQPVYGRTIYWSSNRGSFSQNSVVTDSRGRVVVYYNAPDVTSSTSVEIRADFRGSVGLHPTSQVVYGTVEPAVVVAPLSDSLFYLDFSSGTPQHNFYRVQYRGGLVFDFSLSPAYLLELEGGDQIELQFNLDTVPEEGVLLLWAQGESRDELEVYLNGRQLKSIKPSSHVLGPGDYQEIDFRSNVLNKGTNRLQITANVGRGRVVRVQRVVLVF